MFRPILFFFVTYIRNQGYDICNLCKKRYVLPQFAIIRIKVECYDRLLLESFLLMRVKSAFLNNLINNISNTEVSD